MKKSTRNLAVIQNFILHLTHCSEGEDTINQILPVDLTPKQMYQAALEYIEEDHADGKGNPEDHITTYSAESSRDFEDKDVEFPANIVVMADKGEEGTETVATIENIGNLEEIQHLLKLIQKNG